MIFLCLSSMRQGVHCIALAAAIVFTPCQAAPASAVDSATRGVVGQWKLTAALDAADVASLDDLEAQQLLGHIVTISRDRLTFGERICTAPDFASERVEPALYLRAHYRANASQLGLPNPVTIIHLDCTSAFIKNRNRLVIFWKGWFFDAVRIQRSGSANLKSSQQKP